jgi:hypothetical protein
MGDFSKLWRLPRKRWRNDIEEDLNITGIRNRQAMVRHRLE